MNESANPFLTFTPVDVELESTDQLPEGNHLVKIAVVTVTTDTQIVTDEPDDNIQSDKDWVDVNPVLYVLLRSANGVHHQRFYFNGYMKYDQLINNPKFAKELDKYRPSRCTNARNYAINKETNERLPDPKLSEFARNKVHQFAKAAGCTGLAPSEWVDHELYVRLKKEWKFGKWRTTIIQVSTLDKPLASEPTIVKMAKGHANDPLNFKLRDVE
jgi:hypothetical protein